MVVNGCSAYVVNIFLLTLSIDRLVPNCSYFSKRKLLNQKLCFVNTESTFKFVMEAL